MSDTLTPITREEHFLQAIADAYSQGGGGGDSDFTLATVTIVNNTEDFCEITCPAIYEDELINAIGCDAHSSTEVDAVLYKGFSSGVIFDTTLTPVTPITSGVTVTGDIAFDKSYIDITGTGTITLAGE